MKRIIILIITQFFVYFLIAQNKTSKINLDIQTDFSTVTFDHNSVKTSITGLNALYWINPHLNIMLGEKYNLRYSFFQTVENSFGLTAGVGYLIPIKKYCGQFDLEVYLSGSSIDNQFYTFEHYYTDAGLKLFFKKIAFGSVGLRYNFDEPNSFSFNRNESFNLFIGFGLRIDFEKCSSTHEK